MQYVVTFQNGNGAWPSETINLPAGTSRSQAIKLMRRATRRRKYPVWQGILREVRDVSLSWPPRHLRVAVYYIDRYEGYRGISKRMLRALNKGRYSI